MSLSKTNSDLYIKKRIRGSINVLEMHIYNWPVECWDYEKNQGSLNMCKFAESLGIIKAPDNINLKELKKIMQIHSIAIKNYRFLKNVGRSFTIIQKDQESDFKLKHFVNKSMFSNELFILSADDRNSGETYENVSLPKQHTSPNKGGNSKNQLRILYQAPPNLLNRTRSPTPIRSRTRSPRPMKPQKRNQIELSSNRSSSPAEGSPERNPPQIEISYKHLLTSNEEEKSEKSSDSEEQSEDSLRKTKRNVGEYFTTADNYSRNLKNEQEESSDSLDYNRLSRRKDSSEESKESEKKNRKYDMLKIDTTSSDFQNENDVPSRRWIEQKSEDSYSEGKRNMDDFDEDSEVYQKLKKAEKSTKNKLLLKSLEDHMTKLYFVDNKKDALKDASVDIKNSQKKPKKKSPTQQAEAGLEEKLQTISHDNLVNSEKMRLLKELLQNIKRRTPPNEKLTSKLHEMGFADLYKPKGFCTDRGEWKKLYEKEFAETENLKYYIRRLNDQFVATKCPKSQKRRTFQSNLYPPSDKMNYMISVKILKDEIAELKRRIRIITVSVKEEEIKKQKIENLVPHCRLERNNLNAEMVQLRKKYPKAQMQNDFNKHELEAFIN